VDSRRSAVAEGAAAGDVLRDLTEVQAIADGTDEKGSSR